MVFKNVLREVVSESHGAAKRKDLFLAKTKVGQPKSRLAFSQRKDLTFRERSYQREFPESTALQQHQVTHFSWMSSQHLHARGCCNSFPRGCFLASSAQLLLPAAKGRAFLGVIGDFFMLPDPVGR